MKHERRSGILLHPTSLPGDLGIGELGTEAFRFVDFLEKAGQSLWQVLPLGPTGYGDSPYASFSTFAGNPMMISLEKLAEEGWLSRGDLDSRPDFPRGGVAFGELQEWKRPLLDQAARAFLERSEKEAPGEAGAYQAFCRDHAHWVEDYALFMAVKEDYDRKAREEQRDGAMWSNYWDRDIRLREPAAVEAWREKKAGEIELRKVLQYFFYTQWRAVKAYANSKGIQIIGDIPIFVAPDSVDVWANRELFLIDGDGQPSVVAGVPPDYFSETGQLWGNPLYDWKAMEKRGFRWWLDRIEHMLEMVDIIRIDHFRGFEAYWEIPKGETTAIKGRWVKAPGKKLFETVKEELGTLPILAEDLGLITPEVEELRDYFGFPGMNVLHFAFDAKESGRLDPSNLFLPHNHRFNSVVYTGTHDNDTTAGWFSERTAEEKDLIERYMNSGEADVVWDFIRLAEASVARFAVIPMQDLLRKGTQARMNTPSTLGGTNWAWRFVGDEELDAVARNIRELVELYGRHPSHWGNPS